MRAIELQSDSIIVCGVAQYFDSTGHALSLYSINTPHEYSLSCYMDDSD